MTVSYLDQRPLGFQEYIDRQTQSRLSAPDGTPLYAHPVDEWILRSLNAAPVKAVLDKSLDTFISLQLGQYLSTGIFIDQKSFPDLFEVLSHCSRTLGIPIPHALASSSLVLFNAFTAGTEEYSFIFIADGLCKFFSRDEAAFVIGHECGHIASKHMVYHTLVSVLTDTASRYLGGLGRILSTTAGIPLLAWSRRSEITADRAGLLCCGDLAVAERALLGLVAGLAGVDRVDVDDYLRRYRDMQDFHSISTWQQLFATHPLIPKRIEALRLFARSELYFDLSGKPRPDGPLLNREDLNRRVNQIVKP
ncbi:MAG: M48 family metallopeptidase [Chloroflexi bacterium]|nr:M48 family metallopeptidase [Chloroflexota bacterium]